MIEAVCVGGTERRSATEQYTDAVLATRKASGLP